MDGWFVHAQKISKHPDNSGRRLLISVFSKNKESFPRSREKRKKYVVRGKQYGLLLVSTLRFGIDVAGTCICRRTWENSTAPKAYQECPKIGIYV